MAVRGDYKQMVDYLRTVRSGFRRGHGLAMLEVMVRVEAEAKKNVRSKLYGRVPGRRLSGRLFNSIFTTFDPNKKGDKLVGFAGSRGLPYAAIHEFGSKGLPGGAIRPVSAKNLWIKNWEVPPAFRRMSPTEFVDRMRQYPETYQILESTTGVRTAWYFGTRGRAILGQDSRVWIPLFFLVKRVKIPERPYVRPAIRFVMRRYPLIAGRRVLREMLRGGR